MVLTATIIALLFGYASGSHQILPAGPLLFSCETFPPDLSESGLQTKFGDDHVKSTDVPWGGAEGDSTPGTVLFEGIADLMVQIHWSDAAGKQFPDWVHISGSPTRWRTPAGITVGTDLRTIERLNGRPFRLVGFGTDVQGGVVSWEGGRLESQNRSDCRVGVRLRTGTIADKLELYRQVSGNDRIYSSSHPAMQALNPTVWEMRISYWRRRTPNPNSRTFEP